ncbi:hypothetical protein DIPPA_20796 [Diplonema papillatum]|nr:hypothetical protein DIPPA_20796 [Diplonema papillatum]
MAPLACVFFAYKSNFECVSPFEERILCGSGAPRRRGQQEAVSRDRELGPSRVRQLENMNVRVTPLMIEDVAACSTHGELQSLTEKLLFWQSDRASVDIRCS